MHSGAHVDPGFRGGEPMEGVVEVCIDGGGHSERGGASQVVDNKGAAPRSVTVTRSLVRLRGAPRHSLVTFPKDQARKRSEPALVPRERWQRYTYSSKSSKAPPSARSGATGRSDTATIYFSDDDGGDTHREWSQTPRTPRTPSGATQYESDSSVTPRSSKGAHASGDEDETIQDKPLEPSPQTTSALDERELVRRLIEFEANLGVTQVPRRDQDRPTYESRPSALLDGPKPGLGQEQIKNPPKNSHEVLTASRPRATFQKTFSHDLENDEPAPESESEEE